MATSSEISWLRDYFTLIDNEIVCDICLASHVISVNDDVKIHLHNQHKDVNVSSEDLQENKDSQFYKIQNNSIQCMLCDEIYISKNTNYVIKHLEDKHGITKDIAEEINKLLHYHYKLDESDKNEEQYCNKCKNMIPNKPSFLINHLKEAHKHIIHPKIRLASYYAENWIWDYFIRDEKIAECSICNESYENYLIKTYSSINKHVKRKHKEDYDRVVSSNKSRDQKFYSEIQNNQVKCNICNKSYFIQYAPSIKMKNHLTMKHELDIIKSNILCDWQLKYFNKVDSQTSRCMLCPKIFRKICSFNLIDHLRLHGIEIPPEISSMGKSSSLLNSDENVKDIATSSSDPQSGCNKVSDIEVRDVDYDGDSRIKNLKRLPSIREYFSSFKAAEVIATSSMYQQPTQNFDKISGCYNICDQIVESIENRSTRLPSFYESFHSFKVAKFIATLSTYQQPIQNFDHSSDCDNLSDDQIDESSENK